MNSKQAWKNIGRLANGGKWRTNKRAYARARYWMQVCSACCEREKGAIQKQGAEKNAH